MKKLFIILIILLSSCDWFKKAPVIRTYSISGDIELINDCSGEGTDNPKTIDVNFYLWYNSDKISASFSKVETITMVLQTDGVTSKGMYSISDAPTNMIGKHWIIDFPKACTYIVCDQGNCINVSTNVRQPIKTHITKYDYRYNCTCAD